MTRFSPASYSVACWVRSANCCRRKASSSANAAVTAAPMVKPVRMDSIRTFARST
ncbi:hypothetical protein [Micromonospora haikouensis]|uniref:hypothetical protein n=1 Tax=Micromonospora haikouensis TaxID=686309 RepID=UPI0034E38B2C